MKYLSLEMIPTLNYLCCFMYLCMFQWVKGEYAYVTIDTAFEGKGQCSLPPTIQSSLDTGSEALTLHLIRNDHVLPDVPSYIMQIGESGNYELIVEEDIDTETRAAYQDPLYEAAVTVTCILHPQKGAQFEMEGALFVEGVKYRIVPSQSPVSFFRRLFHPGKEKLYHLVRAQEVVPFDSGIDVEHREQIPKNTLREIRILADHSVHPPTDHPRRVKRGGVTLEPMDINVDVILLLEYSVIQVWTNREGNLSKGKEKAKEYFALVLNAVNLRYQNMESEDYKYNIRLAGFLISETANTSSWSEDNAELKDGVVQTNATQVLFDLRQAINSTRDGRFQYDHIMLFTSYDLVGEDRGFRFNYTTGFTYVSSMCNTEGYSISVVEDRGGFQSVGTAAHELAHSLGARHDGTNNDCLPEDNFLMSPLPNAYSLTEQRKVNPWSFSKCSVASIANFTTEALRDQEKVTCLTRTLSPQGVPDIRGQMPGQLYNPDNQCQQQLGDTSYLCRDSAFDVGDQLCSEMYCYKPQTTYCVQMIAARGTTCGNKKWCIDGSCVNSTDAPAANDNCIHNDQPSLRISGQTMTCSAAIRKEPWLCYSKDFSTPCCNSCGEICDTGLTGCRCGDRGGGCNESNCESYTETGLAVCCYTCRDYRRTTASESTSQQTTSAIPQTTSTTLQTTSTTPQTTSTTPQKTSTTLQTVSSSVTTSTTPQTTSATTQTTSATPRTVSSSVRTSTTTQTTSTTTQTTSATTQTVSSSVRTSTTAQTTSATPQTVSSSVRTSTTTQTTSATPQTVSSSVRTSTTAQTTSATPQKASATQQTSTTPETSETTSTTSETTSTAPETTSTTTEIASQTSPSSTIPGNCTDVSRFNDVTCLEYIQNLGPQVCYNDVVNKSCCETCRKNNETSLKGCEWGDRDPSSCYALRYFKRGFACPRGTLTEKCCKSCAQLLQTPAPPADQTTHPVSSTASTFAYFERMNLLLICFSVAYLKQTEVL